MDMKQWLDDAVNGRLKKPLPILSYPGAQSVCDDVRAFVNDSRLQCQAMRTVADRCLCAGAVTPMDLSVEAQCFGADIFFSKTAVPVVARPLVTSFEGAKNLSVPAVGAARTGIFIDTVKKAKEYITDRPVFAGAVAPFSLAGRLLDVTEIMFLCFDEPETVHLVLEKCTEFLINYVTALKNAGADGVILAEPVAGLLSPDLEAEFSAPYTKRLAQAVKDDRFAVVYHNCGQSVSRMTASIYANGCDAYHFGDSVDLRQMLEKAPPQKPVMGNIAPVALFRDGTPEKMKAAVNALLTDCAGYKNFLLSSGCDIPFDAGWDNIDAFFAASEEYYGG